MNKQNHTFHFNFSPNLIILLGEQLIHDKKIALSELIKNSYDADASEVTVTWNGNELSIEDNGFGMDLDTIKNCWLKPGVSNKKADLERNILTSKYKRLPIGEKGVGRLGCHKLGNVIELWTKFKNDKTIHLQIDWTQLEKAEQLDDIPIQVEEIKDNPFKETGTKIKITQLKEEWDEKDFEKLSKDLTTLIPPLEEIDKFKIFLKKDGELFSENLADTIKMVFDNPLFKFDTTIKNGKINKFEYQFQPWKGLEKVPKREINLNKNKEEVKNHLEKNKAILSCDKELEKYKNLKIGEIRFKGIIYDYDNVLFNIQQQIPNEAKKIIKEYMKSNGGIRVYRDNFRVFNYGEIGNDLLELDLKRVNRPSGKISSNQILASIILDGKESKDLIEKTNREGFINNPALELLKKALDEIISILNNLKQDDKEKIIRIYLEKPEDRVQVEKKIASLQEYVEKANIDVKKKEKINSSLEGFAKDLIHTKQVLLHAANSGLNMTHVVHELDKQVDNLASQVKNQEWEKLPKMIETLKSILQNYRDILKLDKKKETEINEIVQTAFSNVQARFDYHNISFEKQGVKTGLSINVVKSYIMGTLTNLFDNAIYWLNFQKIENKKILVKAYEKESQIHLVIADNGKGFTIDFESALRAFITGRKDESSMGIGLYLADEIMTAHQGILCQGDFEDEGLPSDFKDGAIIKLIFNKTS